MVQVPLVSDETGVVPAMLQMAGVVEAKLTVEPEEAVAVRPTLVRATCEPGFGKVMVCPAWLTKKARLTAGAGP